MHVCTKVIDSKSFAHVGDLISFCVDHEQNSGDDDKNTTKDRKCDEDTAGQPKCTNNLQQNRMSSKPKSRLKTVWLTN